jgi:excisionase family DNA binding protein
MSLRSRPETHSTEEPSDNGRGRTETLQRGYRPREVAKLLRISPQRVRGMIERGELGALNLGRSRCGKPRYVVLPSHLADFARTHQAAKPPVARRRKLRIPKDYYPD